MTISEYRQECKKRSHVCETVECESCRYGPIQTNTPIEEETMEMALVPVVFDQTAILSRLDRIIKLLEAK